MDAQFTGLPRRLFAGMDPVRRARVRAAATRLVGTAPWPGEAATAHDVARLALLRVLWLQKCTRDSAWLGQVEATAHLARAAVEACLVGLYCVYVPAAVDQLNADAAKSIPRLLGFLVKSHVIEQELLDAAASDLGSGRRFPSMAEVVTAIELASDDSAARDLYDRLYNQPSALAVHTSAIALLRHVGGRDQVRARPYLAWTRRSAVHTVDTCVGLLAAAVAEAKGVDSRPFSAYADDHWSRVVVPVAVLWLRALPGSLRPRELPAAVRAVRDLRRYVQSGEAEADSIERRRIRILEGLRTALAVLGIEPGDAAIAPFVDRLLDATAALKDVQHSNVTADESASGDRTST